MITFDATSREVCTAKRETTTTPLQALVLLNDPQFVEAARVLAERLVREVSQAGEARVKMACLATLGRLPEPSEEEVLRRLYSEQMAIFAKDPHAAERYLEIGETAMDKALPKEEVAAMAVLSSTLMNMDEFVTKR
jgi:hypothetical protein